MCVCTVLSSYCWRSFNFSALEKEPLLDHKHIQELGSAKIGSSYLQIQKWDTNRNVFKLLCFVWQTVQTSKIFNLPSLPANPHIFHEKLNAENVFRVVGFWNENASVMKPNPTQTCFLRTLQNPRCIFSQDSHKKKMLPCTAERARFV